MKETIRTRFFKLLIFCAVTLATFGVNGQVRSFYANEKVSIGPNEFLKILKCKGEGEKRVCEVTYFANNKQVGSPFWLTTTAIQKKAQATKKDVQPKPVKTENAKSSKPTPKPPVQIPPKTSKIQPAPKPVETQAAKPTNDFSTLLNKALGNKEQKRIDSPPAPENRKVDSIIPPKVPTDSSELNVQVVDSIKSSTHLEDTISKEISNSSAAQRKLGVFIDCVGCDMNYIRSELEIVDFLLDKNAADVHMLISEQPTGGGGSFIQMIFYGQRAFKSKTDTINTSISANATTFEKRAEMFNAIKIGLVPFINRTEYAKYLSVKIGSTEKKKSNPLDKRDPWNYWVFQLGGNASLNSDQVYKSTEAKSYLVLERTTNKLKVNFSGSVNYNNYKYSYSDSFTSYEYEILNHDYLFEHSLVSSMGSHWGVGYLASYSQSTFSNNKNRAYAKAAIEYSLFPYKDVNTRFFTLSYGVDVRANKYYDSTIYFKTDEVLLGHQAEANMSFNQKWGTFSGTLSYNSFFKDLALNNLSASIKFYFRITGGLFFNLYAYGARVRDQVYLVKGSASVQDVLTRRRELASEYDFGSGIGLDFRFGSKLNNFVNPRMKRL